MSVGREPARDFYGEGVSTSLTEIIEDEMRMMLKSYSPSSKLALALLCSVDFAQRLGRRGREEAERILSASFDMALWMDCMDCYFLICLSLPVGEERQLARVIPSDRQFETRKSCIGWTNLRRDRNGLREEKPGPVSVWVR